MGFSFSLLVSSETFLAFHKKTSVSLWKTHIHSNILMKIVFLKTSNYSNTFEHWPKNLWSLLQNFSTGLWKLHALCPYDYFYGKPFSWEKFIFFFIRDFDRKFFGLLAKNQRWSCEKFILHIDSNILMKIDLS